MQLLSSAPYKTSFKLVNICLPSSSNCPGNKLLDAVFHIGSMLLKRALGENCSASPLDRLLQLLIHGMILQLEKILFAVILFVFPLQPLVLFL